MNRLKIKQNRLEIKKVEAPATFTGKGPFFDYFIDGLPLSQILKVDRFSLAFCGVDLDFVSDDSERGVNIFSKHIAGLIGSEPAQNQISPGRPVLYRCHCGVDYCGIISFDLEISDDSVSWKDIRFQEDEELEEALEVLELVFDKLDYESVFENFRKLNQ